MADAGSLVCWQANKLWYQDAFYSEYGFAHLQRMMIVKLDDHSLMVINPIELTPRLKQQMQDLGQISAIVAPSPKFHHSLSDWWLAYPEARLFGTAGLIQKRTDLRFDGALAKHAPNLWQNDLMQTALSDLSRPTKMFFYEFESKTLIMPELLIGFQPHLPLGQKIDALVHGVRQELGLSLYRRQHFKNKALLRASVQEIMTWPFERILSTNGLMIEKDAKKAFFQAFWWVF